MTYPEALFMVRPVGVFSSRAPKRTIKVMRARETLVNSKKGEGIKV